MGRGRGNKSRTQRKHFRDGRENAWKRQRPDSTDTNEIQSQNPEWRPFATQNLAFEEYYKEQRIVSDEEWDRFMQVLRSPLPASFRINSSAQFCADIKHQLEHDFMKSLEYETEDGSETQALRPLLWYPSKLAWHSNFSRMQLRKNQSLERFHEFLKLENEIGNITRQEAVSMVPPLLLDVQPDHLILDMCAAPGSKTFQLLEIIYQSMKPGILPDGMVIANDLDVQRCNLLIHQTKRMCTANLIVTNNEAQQFPSCRPIRSLSEVPEKTFEQPISQLLFDRVLCDVPCSGDGTLRKAPDMWKKWSSGMGNGLHGLQLQIAMRGVSLLKVGGKMVYSTCSMNPVENEAVVSEVLRRCGGAVDLIDVSKDLPELVRRPGLKSWKVWDKSIWLSSHNSALKNRKFGVVPSMFPSGRCYSTSTKLNGNDDHVNDKNYREEEQEMADCDILDEDDDHEVSDLPLERCVRIVPHDQNTGAFFIAVFQKVSPLTASQEMHAKRVKSDKIICQSRENCLDPVVEVEELALEGTTCSGLASESDSTSKVVGDNSVPIESERGDTQEVYNDEKIVKDKEKRKFQIQGRWKGVDPVIFFKDSAIIDSIKEFYGIIQSFPLEGHLIARNMDDKKVKRIYYVSQSVKCGLELNFLSGQQLKISSVGLKMFERQSASKGDNPSCVFRISSEGLPLILPYITKQILYASYADFKHLLEYKVVKFCDFVESEVGLAASNLSMGCCVILLKNGNQLSIPPIVETSTMAIGCWKGRGSLSVMVTAIDCQELLHRLCARMEDTFLEPKNSEGEQIHSTEVQVHDQ